MSAPTPAKRRKPPANRRAAAKVRAPHAPRGLDELDRAIARLAAAGDTRSVDTEAATLLLDAAGLLVQSADAARRSIDRDERLDSVARADRLRLVVVDYSLATHALADLVGRVLAADRRSALAARKRPSPSGPAGPRKTLNG